MENGSQETNPRNFGGQMIFSQYMIYILNQPVFVYTFKKNVYY